MFGDITIWMYRDVPYAQSFEISRALKSHPKRLFALQAFRGLRITTAIDWCWLTRGFLWIPVYHEKNHRQFHDQRNTAWSMLFWLINNDDCEQWPSLIRSTDAIYIVRVISRHVVSRQLFVKRIWIWIGLFTKPPCSISTRVVRFLGDCMGRPSFNVTGLFYRWAPGGSQM